MLVMDTFLCLTLVFFFKQKTAYEMRISDWSSDVCSSDLLVLNPRGERYSADSISERLSMRDMMEELRSVGIDTGGPAAFSQADRRAFANALDQLLQKALREDAARG